METDPIEETRMTLGEHLSELQSRLLRSTIVLAIAFAVGWTYHEELTVEFYVPYDRATAWLTESLETKLGVEVEEGRMEWEEAFTTPDPETRELAPEWRIPPRPKGDGVSVGFFFYMRIAFYFALFFGGPFFLWQLWQFIAAGLYPSEKRLVNRYFPFSALLFLAGVLFGYFVLVPYAIFFLADMSIMQVQYYESVDNYMTFVTSLTLALGAVFQLPIVMIVLSQIGLVAPKTYSQYRPHFIVGALVIAAILTPPDPFTQMMLAGPMVVLYELGQIAARFVYKPAPIESDDEDELEGALS